MRTAAIDFQVATAEEIFNALVHNITTTSALYSFQNRVGTNKRNTKKALDMLRQYKLEQKRNARYRQAIKTKSNITIFTVTRNKRTRMS